MTIDLWCLVANALWGVFLVQYEVFGKTRAGGTAWNAGNRDTQPKVAPQFERASRALANHKENFPLFLTAVVVVALAGKADHVSAYASIGYVVFRALHGIIYIAGITKVRSLMFVLSIVCVVAILSRLV